MRLEALSGVINRRLLALAFLVLALQPGETRGGAEANSLLERLIAAETGCPDVCPPANSAGALRARLDRLADQARGLVDTQRDAVSRVESLNRFIFGHLGIGPASDLTDADNLLLTRVLDRRQGYCVGIASLYLVLAERLGLPIYAVATPSHAFVRYDDGATRINIETLQSGSQVPDEQFILAERIPEKSIRKGVFMRNLSAEEFLAQVHNNLGVIYSRRGSVAQAAEDYRRATDLAPRFPAPYYNYASDLLKYGDYRRAARLFTKSLRLYPIDVWALNNRALAYIKMGKREKARKDFEAALRIEPGFEQARKNLEGIESPQ